MECLPPFAALTQVKHQALNACGAPQQVSMHYIMIIARKSEFVQPCRLTHSHLSTFCFLTCVAEAGTHWHKAEPDNPTNLHLDP